MPYRCPNCHGHGKVLAPSERVDLTDELARAIHLAAPGRVAISVPPHFFYQVDQLARTEPDTPGPETTN